MINAKLINYQAQYIKQPISEKYNPINNLIIISRPNWPHRVIILVSLHIESIDNKPFLFVRSRILIDYTLVFWQVLHYPPKLKQYLFRKHELRYERAQLNWRIVILNVTAENFFSSLA